MKLLASIGACLLVGLLGAAATASSVASWYPTLEKPAWTPPDGLFGPVWTTLYVLMGLSLWRVLRRRASRLALGLFAAQLALNAAWSAIFFGLRSPGWALVEIVVLWGAIAGTALAFHRVDRVAAWLLAPYLLWVSFAAALNLAIVSMNA